MVLCGLEHCVSSFLFQEREAVRKMDLFSLLSKKCPKGEMKGIGVWRTWIFFIPCRCGCQAGE